MNPTLQEYCLTQLEQTEKAGLLRRLQSWEKGNTRTICIQGRNLLNFASNDYLGLSVHPKVREALRTASEEMVGAAASRLITGNHTAYTELENEIARFKKAEAAVVFTSGYAAATGTIPALVGDKDFIVMDKLCHASLVDGAALSGATLRVFPHGNLKRCEELLATCRSRAKEGRVLLVSESVFSMDGDLAPLVELVTLKKKYGAWLMVDEAHATGVLGANGRGGAEYFGVEGEIDVSMGTFSKALGCLGGFICGVKELKELLINRARSLVYSTGLPPAICRAATTACMVARQEPQWRESLWKNINLFREIMGSAQQSPIFPVMVGDERRCVQIAEQLREQGFMVPAIRYPTVSRGKARLRVSLSAVHGEEDIQNLAAQCKKLLCSNLEIELN
jgi:8-amino-7-oxononanoate synthase